MVIQAGGGSAVDEVARFTSSNNLLVGGTSSFGKLAINSNGAPASSGNMTTGLTVHNDETGTAINIGTNDAGGYNYIQSAYVNSAGTARNLTLFAGATRAVDIDTSGNLLVGKPSVGVGTVGGTMYANGTGKFTVDGGIVSYFNRLTSDGTILSLRKDTTEVGSIGSIASDLYIAEGNSGLRFDGENNQILPSSTTASTDGTCSLGASSARFDDIYATNGTIQTSDRNEKQDIEELSDAEQRVAVAAKGLLRKFRWKDAVEDKGDEARIHFGIIAQDLQDAFTAEGLDAGRYAMFINTTLTDEETGEERSRMGVRYSELLAFIISAI